MTTPTTPTLPEPATDKDSLTVGLQRMTPGIFAGDLAMFPSPDGKYVRLSDAQALAGEVERLRAALADVVDRDWAYLGKDADTGNPQSLYSAVRRGRIALDASRALATQEAK